MKTPRDCIQVCSVHGKFQKPHGRWIDKSELKDHIEFTGSQNAALQETMCDKCLDTDEILFI